MNDNAGLPATAPGPILPWLYVDSRWWTAFGLLGNALFSSRFVIQWLHSEKTKELVVPPIFWHLSFWGSDRLAGLRLPHRQAADPALVPLPALPLRAQPHPAAPGPAEDEGGLRRVAQG